MYYYRIILILYYIQIYEDNINIIFNNKNELKLELKLMILLIILIIFSITSTLMFLQSQLISLTMIQIKISY